MSGEGAAGSIGDGPGNDQRQFIPDFFTDSFISKNSGFGIEGIKDGFDQDQINTAVNKAFELFRISFDQLVKINSTESRIIDIRRDRRCSCSGAYGPGHKARFMRGCLW